MRWEKQKAPYWKKRKDPFVRNLFCLAAAVIAAPFVAPPLYDRGERYFEKHYRVGQNITICNAGGIGIFAKGKVTRGNYYVAPNTGSLAEDWFTQSVHRVDIDWAKGTTNGGKTTLGPTMTVSDLTGYIGDCPQSNDKISRSNNRRLLGPKAQGLQI